MFRTHGASGRPSILALVYADGGVAGRFISDLGYRLRNAGVAVTGIVPYHQFACDGAPNCDMELEELASRIIIQLSDDQAGQADGCRLDPAAMLEAAALISASLRNAPELVILNKFGRLEVEGGGLRDVIAEAVELRIPVIAGVPERYLAPWRVFTDGLAEEAPLDSRRLHQWLSRRGIDIRREGGAVASMAAVSTA